MNQVFIPFGTPREIYIKVRWLFNLALFQSRLARMLGSPESPYDFNEVCKWMCLKDWKYQNTEDINLKRIIGAEEGGLEFDRIFRPKYPESLREDWERWAIGIHMGMKIPTLEIYQWGEAYFIQDRLSGILVSVLRALGYRTIQAHILGPNYSEVPPPTIELLDSWERGVNVRI